MTALLEVRDLKVHFPTRRGLVQAIDGVDFRVQAGETLGLVGESGSGKSTLGKAIVGLVPTTSGQIALNGVTVTGLSRSAMRPLRPTVQMIFQDPFASLNPRLRVGRLIEEPLTVHRRGNRGARKQRVADLMAQVGLHPDAGDRLPHEFSGGQRQRVGIARALALDPALIICDEAVSALDVSIQAQIINLLRDLQKQRGFAYLFISHDLSVVRHIADRIMVLYLGRVVEIASRRSLWSQPRHPYTQALIAAVPRPVPKATRGLAASLIGGEIPSPIHPPSGCRFRTRCPLAAPICTAEVPALRLFAEDHGVACHFAETTLRMQSTAGQPNAAVAG